MPLRNKWWWFYSFTAHQVDGCQILLFLKQHLTIAFKSFCTFLTSERNGTRMARWKGKTPFLNTFKNLDLTSLQYSPFSQRVITIAFYWESISPAVGPVPVGLIYQSSSMHGSQPLSSCYPAAATRDKKTKYKKIEMESGAKWYMRKSFLIYEEMHKYFHYIWGGR
jgi:hypothetical protein